MSVSNSPTDIVNLALDIIKTENISDVEMPGTDEIAAVANRWYDDVRQLALEDHPWSFSTRRANIPLIAVTPLFEYTDVYQLPSDYLALWNIKEDSKPLSYWTYALAEKRIEMNNDSAESLYIRYSWDNVSVSTYSPSFKIYLAHLLASFVVTKLTGNAGAIKRVQSLLPVMRAQAKATNGKSSPPVAYIESKMLRGRRLYGG